jgi:hypothetical protein
MQLVELQGCHAFYERQVSEAREMEMLELKWLRYLTAANTLVGALLLHPTPHHTVHLQSEFAVDVCLVDSVPKKFKLFPIDHYHPEVTAAKKGPQLFGSHFTRS